MELLLPGRVVEHDSQRLPVALNRDPRASVVRLPGYRQSARVDVQLALRQEVKQLQTWVDQQLAEESLSVLGRGAAGAQIFEEVGHPAQRVVAGSVEAPIDGVLHTRAQWAKRNRNDERGGRGRPPRPTAECRAQQYGRRSERQRQNERDGAVDERAVDDDVDVVEAVSEDGEARGQRNGREAEAEHCYPCLQSPGWPDEPSRHEQSGRGGRGEASCEHELELLTLDAPRSAQADNHRCRSEPDPGDHEQPAGEVDRVHRPARTCEAERIRRARERLGIRPGAHGSGDHEQEHPDQEARQRRPPPPRGEPPVREQEQREAEQSRRRLPDHVVEYRRRSCPR